jgi:hypothetical protein
MTAEEFRAALARLGLTAQGAARRWGMPMSCRADEPEGAKRNRNVQRWCGGSGPIPHWVPIVIALEEGRMKRRCEEIAP